MRVTLLVLGGIGLAGLIALVAWTGFDDVMRALAVAGWGLLLLPLVHLATATLADAVGWHVLFQPGRRPPFLASFWMRWVCESVNTLLPVGQVGGELVRARLMARDRDNPAGPGIGGAEAGATVIADVTTGLVGTVVFTVLGALMLVQYTLDPELRSHILWSVAGMLGVLVLFIGFQRGGFISLLGRLAHRMAGDWLPARMVGGVEALDRQLGQVYRRWPQVLASVVWRFLSLLGSVLETWVTLWLLGAEVGLAEAFILESLRTAARSAAFAVPGGLGVQEGALVFLGTLLGLSGPVALALALAKRVSEVLTGLPGLVIWASAEGRIALAGRAASSGQGRT